MPTHPTSPINLAAHASTIAAHWTPQHILTLNESHSLKLARIHGAFVWHAHPATDELFYVVSGGPMQLELEGLSTVTLGAGDVFCVPQGLRHRPVAEVETAILLVEKVGTVNTGDMEGREAAGERTVYVDEGL